jgi:membrane protein
MFKYLPDAHPPVAWKDIWVGAFTTAALFTLGKYAIGLYLGRSSVASAYGAAGSFVVLLVWVYYSAQILFFGAELTQVYARRHGSRLGLSTESGAADARGDADEAPSPKEAGRTAGPKSAPPRVEPVPPIPPRPPTSAVGRGLAMSAVLLLLPLVGKKKGWPF